MHAISTCGLLGLLLAGLAEAQPAQPAQPPQRGDLREGVVAPGFTLKDVDGKNAVRLAALKGKPVVLIFGSCT